MTGKTNCDRNSRQCKEGGCQSNFVIHDELSGSRTTACHRTTMISGLWPLTWISHYGRTQLRCIILFARLVDLSPDISHQDPKHDSEEASCRKDYMENANAYNPR